MVFGITAALCVAVSIGLHGRLPAFPERIHNRILNKDEKDSGQHMFVRIIATKEDFS